MFEKELAEKLKSIFKVKKVTFAQPGENNEQECIFVSVDQPRIRFKDGRAIARVSGSFLIQGNSEKMPFGYLSKMWQESPTELKKDLALFDLEQNDKYYQNLVQRSASFTYFFSTQYDENVGTIDSIDIQIQET